MNATTMNRWLGLVVAGLALAVAGCDPYEEPSDANPAVVRVTLTGGTPVYIEEPDVLDGVWRVPDLIDPSTNALLVVTTNKLLSGSSIQTSVSSCVPAAGAFDFTNAPLIAGNTWYACYYPSSASTSWGASILIYQSTTDADPGTAELDLDTTYTIVGSVLDVQGKALDFEVEFTTTP